MIKRRRRKVISIRRQHIIKNSIRRQFIAIKRRLSAIANRQDNIEQTLQCFQQRLESIQRYLNELIRLIQVRAKHQFRISLFITIAFTLLFTYWTKSPTEACNIKCTVKKF
ncbi:unnamed protein product [Bursaphelenchus okinawaensis]|uniref:Uncharacterized protein n=1 Tax=Bursaphelenchus okinawaensis TaxID=465554 RepID=A0A811KAZ9_9BILA|nr:unnamed protein product [Bursaphelenchus okinawaensis]CAG9098311.1 unnamed protein product [Bursaphelenchus okinawaensis]